MSSKTDTPASHTTPSPSTTGPTLLRAALALESAFNLFLAHGMLLHPHATATQLFLPASTITTSPPPSTLSPDGLLTALLTQWIGVWTLATTVPLLLALPNGAGAAERRFVAYVTLGAMEALWVPLLVWRARREPQALGWARVVGGQVAPMAACLVWRAWVVFARPAWMEGTGVLLRG